MLLQKNFAKQSLLVNGVKPLISVSLPPQRKIMPKIYARPCTLVNFSNQADFEAVPAVRFTEFASPQKNRRIFSKPAGIKGVATR